MKKLAESKIRLLSFERMLWVDRLASLPPNTLIYDRVSLHIAIIDLKINLLRALFQIPAQP